MDPTDIRNFASSWTCFNGHVTELRFDGVLDQGDGDLHGIGGSGWDFCDQCYQVTNIEQVNAGYWDIRKQYMVVQPWVLVLPRESIDTCVSFTPWRRVQHRLVEFTKDATWLRRPLAEWSHSHVQVIPCAVVRNTSGEFFAVRRVRSTRTDISDRLSLVFGGHVDYEDIREDFPKTIACTLRRELLEETGVKSPRNSPDPIGLLADGSSPAASRHVAFLHQVAAEEVVLRGSEEYLLETGSFREHCWLSKRQSSFDPWSRLIIRSGVLK